MFGLAFAIIIAYLLGYMPDTPDWRMALVTANVYFFVHIVSTTIAVITTRDK